MDGFPPTLDAAQARLLAVRPGDYARSRNHVQGAVTRLSPYITHGFLNLREVLAAVNSRYPLEAQHKLVFELGWRAYFRHVWQQRGDAIWGSLHQGPLPESAYAMGLPPDVRRAATGVPVVDMAVRTLYASGYLHNHARMWLASYLVHMRKVHWRTAADWMYGHLLDGDLASNHLSWQWVAGTGSSKPYLFNAENVARYAPTGWHSWGSVVDQDYESLDRLARLADSGRGARPAPADSIALEAEPPLLPVPPSGCDASPPNATDVAGSTVWLVHPWNLCDVPATVPPGTIRLGLFVADFHEAWPWSERRWQFVGRRMAELTTVRWHGSAASIGTALEGARQVLGVDDPHLRPWLARWAECKPQVALFAAVDRRCDSFSQWWTRAMRGVGSASELLRG